jgi:hypothetical protein
MNTRLSFAELVVKIKKVCSDFLKEHGGANDKYNTFITGEVINEYGFRTLGWMTPTKHHMDHEMMNTLGRDLYHEVHKLLLQSEFSSIQFKVDTDDNGFLHTHITFLQDGGEIFL